MSFSQIIIGVNLCVSALAIFVYNMCFIVYSRLCLDISYKEQFLHDHKSKSNLFGHTHQCNKFKEKLFSHIIQSHSFLIFLPFVSV